MKRTITGFVGAVFVLALQALPVGAADFTKIPVEYWTGRWYWESRIGGFWPQSYNITTLGIGTGTYRPDSGFHTATAIGKEFSPHWRAEVELNWTEAHDGRAFGLAHAGKVTVHGLLGSILYSFDLTPAMRAFVGAGLGLAHYRVKNLGAIGGAFVANDSDLTFGAALHAGIDVPLAPIATFTARYSLYALGDVSFASVPAGFTTRKASGVDHVFTAGFRFYR
jgi:opacity protein-like surface antigen